MTTNRTARRGFLPTACCCLLTAVLNLGIQRPTPGAEPSALATAQAVEQAFVDAIAKAEKSVVAIAQHRSYKPDRGPVQLRRDAFDPGLRRVPVPNVRPQDNPDFIPTEFGTGVVIDRRGLILTNFHVLGHGTDDYTVQHWVTTANKKWWRATIKAADPRSDLAVLEIEASDLTAITFGDLAQVKKGQFVIALGNPYAIARDGQVSASHGIVANLARKAGPVPTDSDNRSEVKPTIHHYGTLIQTDAKLNLGTSGGALLNLRGEMVGLTTSAAAGAGYEQAAGYAVPVDDLFRRVLKNLKEGREIDYGFLGISPHIANEFHAPVANGIRIGGVVAGTAAARAGLKSDDIITHVDGSAIRDADELFLAVGRLPAGTQVQVSVLRNERTERIPVQLTKYPLSERRVVTAPVAPAWRGLRVDDVTSQPRFRELSRASRIPEDPCLLITDVERDSPAQQAGLAAGMYLTHLEERRVTTPTQFQAEAKALTGTVTLRLLVEEKADDPAIVSYDFRPRTVALRAKAE